MYIYIYIYVYTKKLLEQHNRWNTTMVSKLKINKKQQTLKIWKKYHKDLEFDEIFT
jgi:hypothetical protein